MGKTAVVLPMSSPRSVGNSSGFTNQQSPQGGTFNRDLLDQNAKSPLFPGVGEGRVNK